MRFKLNTAFLFISITGLAQIPKNANTIIITDTVSKDQLYNKVTEILFEAGYGILNSNKESGIITTTEKPFKKGIIRLNLMVRNNKIIIRGDFDMGITLDYGGVLTALNWSPIEYYGMKKSPNIIAWNEMQKISDAFPGQKEYLIK
jgi:hypothetical protein